MIFDSSLFCGVFSINFKYALPTITASAPALMYFFTSLGFEIPKPIPTGVKTGIKNYTIKAIKNIKKQTKGKVPVGVGFGISTPKDVKKYMKAGADAVIVGSAFLKLIEKTPQHKLESKITSFTKSLKKQTIL